MSTVIEVSGGVVTAVYSTHMDDFYILDHDNNDSEQFEDIAPQSLHPVLQDMIESIKTGEFQTE